MNQMIVRGTRRVMAAYNAIGASVDIYDMLRVVRGIIAARVCTDSFDLWRSIEHFCDVCESCSTVAVRNLSFTTGMGVHFDRPDRCTTFLWSDGPDDVNEFLDNLTLLMIWDKDDARKSFERRFSAVIADRNSIETVRVCFSVPETGTDQYKALMSWISGDVGRAYRKRGRASVEAVCCNAILDSIGYYLVDFDISCVHQRSPFTVTVRKGYKVPNWRTDEEFPPVIEWVVSGSETDWKEDSDERQD